MGHKVHPYGFRIGVIRDWQARWYANKDYAEFLQEDLKLRQGIRSRYGDAGISLVEIERQATKVTVNIHTARPGVVIGRGGQRVDEMRTYLENLIGKKIQLNIQEIQQPELDAYLVAKTIAEQMKQRIAYRRAMKQAIFRTIQAGAKGIRISCGGRLGGAEIARRQTMHQGQVPLHTLRADVDYGFTESHTTLGRIGVEVWIYKGDILPEPKKPEGEEMPAELATSEPQEAISAAEPEAEAAEPAAAETLAAPPVTAKRKRSTAKSVDKSAEPVPEAEAAELAAVESVEAAPPVTAKRKRSTAKPVDRRTKPVPPAPVEPEAEAAEPAAAETAAAAPPRAAKRKRSTAKSVDKSAETVPPASAAPEE